MEINAVAYVAPCPSRFALRSLVPTLIPFKGRGVSAGHSGTSLRRARVDALPTDSAMEATPV